MAFIISQIQINGAPYCCDPSTMMTQGITTGDAEDLGVELFKLFHTPPFPEDGNSGRVYEGTVTFGVCCAKKVTIVANGRIETLNANFERFRIYLNGETKDEWFVASEDTSDDRLETVSTVRIFEIPLEDMPCGNIVKIEATTEDAIANNEVFWYAQVTID